MNWEVTRMEWLRVQGWNGCCCCWNYVGKRMIALVKERLPGKNMTCTEQRMFPFFLFFFSCHYQGLTVNQLFNQDQGPCCSQKHRLTFTPPFTCCCVHFVLITLEDVNIEAWQASEGCPGYSVLTGQLCKSEVILTCMVDLHWLLLKALRTYIELMRPESV